MHVLSKYNLDLSFNNIINNPEKVDKKKVLKPIMFCGKKKIYNNIKKYHIYVKLNFNYFFKFLNQKIYIKNSFKKKNYKLPFKKDLKKVNKDRNFLNAFEKNSFIKIDMISGEILNKTGIHNTFIKYKSRFNFLKKKDNLFLLHAKFLILNIKKKKKTKRFSFRSKTKLVSLRNNIYILNNNGKFLIIRNKMKHINDVITLNFKNSYNLNLRKITGDKIVILTVNSNKCQSFIFFLTKWRNFLFFRNPIFLKFDSLINNMNFISIKKLLFFFLYFNSIILPIQINLKSTCLLKKKSKNTVFYYKQTLSSLNFYGGAKKNDPLIQLNLMKKCNLLKFKKKHLVLTFKKYKKKNYIAKEIIRNLLIKIEKMFKYKLYKNGDPGLTILNSIKKFLNKLEPKFTNPLINFVIKTLFIFDKNFLKNSLLIGEIFRYHFLSLKNNEFFFGFISQIFNYSLLPEHEILFKSIDEYILRGYHKQII